MPIPLLFRTTDLLKWGAGKGSNLDAGEIDENFWTLWTLINDLTSEPLQPLEIQTISVTGDQMTITLSDATTTFGPFTLPKGALNFLGAFDGGFAYHAFDLITGFDSNGDQGLYVVLQDHISESDFNPADGNTEGLFYKLVMPMPNKMDVGFFFPGAPGFGIGTGQAMFTYRFARDAFILANAPGSVAGLEVASFGDLSFTIQKNGTTIGTLDFTHLSSTESEPILFNIVDPVQFLAGDTIRVLRPTDLDDEAADLSVTFAMHAGTLP